MAFKDPNHNLKLNSLALFSILIFQVVVFFFSFSFFFFYHLFPPMTIKKTFFNPLTTKGDQHRISHKDTPAGLNIRLKRIQESIAILKIS